MEAAGAFGDVFLMFSIVLEISLSKLRVMRGNVFGLGFAQVAITLEQGGIVVILGAPAMLAVAEIRLLQG